MLWLEEAFATHSRRLPHISSFVGSPTIVGGFVKWGFSLIYFRSSLSSHANRAESSSLRQQSDCVACFEVSVPTLAGILGYKCLQRNSCNARCDGCSSCSYTIRVRTLSSVIFRYIFRSCCWTVLCRSPGYRSF